MPWHVAVYGFSHGIALSVHTQLVGQYSALSKYFLKTLPAGDKATCAGNKRTEGSLEDESTVVYLNFVSLLASCLFDFVKLFKTR